jgi:hypothetical protein
MLQYAASAETGATIMTFDASHSVEAPFAHLARLVVGCVRLLMDCCTTHRAQQTVDAFRAHLDSSLFLAMMTHYFLGWHDGLKTAHALQMRTSAEQVARTALH